MFELLSNEFPNMDFLNIKSMGVACKCVLRTCFVILNNMYCIPTYVVWMVIISPLRRYHPDLYWKIEGHFFHWLLAMVSMWSWSAGYDIVELGDDIRTCLEERTLVIANHQSTADVPLLMATFNTKRHVLPNLMWIMDRVFKYTNFGIVSVIHQDFFIVSGREKRDESLRALMRHLRDSYIPRRRKWMVLFPEGGFLRKRRETSQKFALKNNLPVLQHVSLPRVGAMHTIVDIVGPSDPTPTKGPLAKGPLAANNNTSAAPAPAPSSSPSPPVPSAPATPSPKQPPPLPAPLSHLQGAEAFGCELNWVLDITIAYPEGKPLDLGAIVTGYRPPCKTLLFYRLYPCKEVPRDHEQMTKWLYDRFIEKERMLDAYYKTGQFPAREFCRREAPPQPPHEVTQDALRFAILHLFFITSTYIHFQMLSYALSFFWY